ncbi:hypothetical protein QBC32DRAFT_328497 [Pseudoneurospora amorphoporcata]|uniref:Uncharacterized protein n=1 Tax=Pseudoneurospora amorphoporcata TaxID=241081 RepID=A0AAN6SBX7_9PEZI|nr:hypothetical protein QBC32DRAFT_328497 [Pseudoneurospora amorphoporcata]
MESTDGLTRKMEDMALNPKARALTPSTYTATTSSYAHSVFSQLQPESNSSFTAYTTRPTGFTFSNPTARGSSSMTTTTADTTSTTTQSEDHNLAKILMNCDDPVGLYNFRLYNSKSNLHKSPSHYRPFASSHRITKSRSNPSLRKRYRQSRQQIQVPFPSTIVHEARVERVPGTKTIIATAAEEEAKEEKDRKTMTFFLDCLRRTRERVAAEKAAEAARKSRLGLEMGAFGEAWMPKEKVSRRYVNEEDQLVEVGWHKAIYPTWSWEEASDDDGLDVADAVDKNNWREEDDMLTTHTMEGKLWGGNDDDDDDDEMVE